LSLLNLLLVALGRETKVVGKPQLSNSANNENEIIRASQQFIGTHVQQKLSVPMVAKGVDVSPSYLTALFHKHLHLSPGEYVRRIKLDRSKQLIREGQLNFTQISENLQYSTVHHFSRQFKQMFGMTPTEYAKSVR
jgi:YesN/AraC family two-component response regulator